MGGRSASATRGVRLADPVTAVAGVGPRRAADLACLDLRTVEDLLYHFPHRYEDRRVVVGVREARPGTLCWVRGRVASVRCTHPLRGRSVLRVELRDGEASLEAVWFRQGYLRGRFRPGDRVLLYGRVRAYRGLQMANPEFVTDAVPQGAPGDPFGLEPVHPCGGPVRPRFLRRIIRCALDAALPGIEDPLPEGILRRRGLVTLPEALREIHRPRGPAGLARARRRLVYQEFFLLQLGLALRRRGEEGGSRPGRIRVDAGVERGIRALFPFPLTGDQERAVAEIRRDLLATRPMRRLLQGEVGSGKTAVALHAMMLAALSGRQAALMAPTEILAFQHARTVSRFLEGTGIPVGHLPGGLPGPERQRRLERIRTGADRIVVGTHALLQNDVRFRDLALAVVDEQHKFGVPQRARLGEKGRGTNVLVMTATPIPRTLSLTVFGDLDVSTLRELPRGRRPPETRVVTPEGRGRALREIREELRSGRQGYLVCPLVEETADRDIAAAVREYERLRGDMLSDLRVGLIHGRLAARDKEGVMEAFRGGRLDLLVGTVVVEVGLDVPRATVLVVSDAERFGLAQLHQLRGRVGRGDRRGRCWFLLGRGDGPGVERARLVARTTDGFALARADLRLRGPGEFFGTRQHGLPRLRIGDPVVDLPLLEEARRDAFAWVASDPGLRACPSRLLRESLERRFPGARRWIGVG